MEPSEIIEFQNEIVVSITSLIPSEWSMLVLNFETLESESGSTITNRICFWVNENGNEFNNDNLSITLEVEDKLLTLRHELKENGKAWDVCDLTIFPSGQYDINFSYDGPKRLLGEFDFDSMFKYDSHLEEYKRRIEALS